MKWNFILIVFLITVIFISGCVTENIVRQTSISMESTIKKGEIVKIEKVDISEIKEGDVIMFRTDYLPNPVLTRIISIDYEKGTFTSKGDNNPVSWDWEKDVPLEKIEARVISK